MKVFLLLAGLFLFSGQSLIADECFTAKPAQNLTVGMCGPVEATITIKDCTSNAVSKTFTATMGLDCLDTPVKLKLLYNKKMFVGEVTQFDDDADLILSKTYVEQNSRSPAQATPRVEKGGTCFSMRPIEQINSQTCDPVRAQIQFQSCSTHKPVGEKLEVTTHYSCGRTPELKYWYKKMMLVGSLKKTAKGFKVAKTFALIYPSIYGVYNDRTTSSVSNGN